MTGVSSPGENKAWEVLAAKKPKEVCRAAAVSYDAISESYWVKSFGMEFSVSVRDKGITSTVAGSDVLLQKLGYFFKLSMLWYLASSRDITCTGRLVKLQYIKGGDIFTKGSHVLPLEPLARKYGKNKEGFIDKGKSIGGELTNLGDAALRLFPLPRIPVVLSLWLEDDEFPARADLFFDSTCDLQIPTDIIWSVAMMSTLVML